MGKPTYNDWNSYYQRSKREKAETLYYYLYENNKMSDVRDIVGFNDSQAVSNITRCNGFYVENGNSIEQGRYNGGRITKPLDKKYRKLKLSKDDFYDFVEKYPDGIEDYRTLDEFMIERHKLRCGILDTNEDFYYEKRNHRNIEVPYSESTQKEKPSLLDDMPSEVAGCLGCGFLIFIIFIIIFRHQIMNFLIELIPFVISILILVALFKYVLGNKKQ